MTKKENDNESSKISKDVFSEIEDWLRIEHKKREERERNRGGGK